MTAKMMTTRAGATIVASFDARTVTALYLRYGKEARNIIRRGYTHALSPVREAQRNAWLSAKYGRNGKRSTRRAIAACVVIKRKPYRTALGMQDHACVGVDYKKRNKKLQQRVAHLLERGRGGRHPMPAKLIAYRLNQSMLAKTVERMAEFVMRFLNA